MTFHGRAAAQIENSEIRVTVLVEGGHIAEILHKKSGVNPLWIPPWPTVEPSAYRAATDSTYGRNSESKLLAGIMGHNLCLDIFGPPSPAEAAAGLTVHGEASVVRYKIQSEPNALHASATLPLSSLRVSRSLVLPDETATLRITESVENYAAHDRPIAWTQHVTLGPPFLYAGKTHFSLSPSRSRTFETPFGASKLKPAADFLWPHAPLLDGGSLDLSTYTSEASSAKFTTHLFTGETASFTAENPSENLRFGYRWKTADFPWLGIWEENRSRTDPPWNDQTITCGMEFGVSPFPETRRQMIERGSLFGVPGYRWIAAGERLTVEYVSFFDTLATTRA